MMHNVVAGLAFAFLFLFVAVGFFLAHEENARGHRLWAWFWVLFSIVCAWGMVSML